MIFGLLFASYPDDDPGPRSELAQQSDEALVTLARDWARTLRGRQAAAILLKRYRANVYRWCRHLLRNDELALDVSQEVLLAAYENLGRFGERARFSSWLFAIARNRCLSQLRKVRPSTDSDDVLDRLPSGAGTPLGDLEQQDEEDALLRRLAECLTPREQEAVWLKCVEGYSVDEITEMLAIDGTTGARSVLQNARRKLRRRWPEAADGKDPKS